MLSLIFSVLAGGFDAPVSLSNCALKERDWMSSYTIMECDITNLHPTEAIAALGYEVTMRDENRQVPWAKSGVIDPRKVSISGGIEPSETVRHMIAMPFVEAIAKPQTMIVEFTKLEAIGPDGKPLTLP